MAELEKEYREEAIKEIEGVLSVLRKIHFCRDLAMRQPEIRMLRSSIMQLSTLETKMAEGLDDDHDNAMDCIIAMTQGDSPSRAEFLAAWNEGLIDMTPKGQGAIRALKSER